MFKTIDETLDWIHTHLPHGIKPGLSRMEWVMDKLGHPERTIRAIHVGGTNGKGSTVSFLRSVLMETFEEVGTFTSPYIVSFNERIAVNNQPISDEDLVKAANMIYPFAEELGKSDLGYPTEFEVITMISLVYFSRIHPCDVVIYEVGLGGRLDSTNIIYPLVSVITNVGIDHVAQLGGTITEIASEKAGIIKSGTPIVTTAEHPDALKVIQEKATQMKAKLYQLGQHFEVVQESSSAAYEEFHFKSLYWNFSGLKSSLRGPHQIKNASAALKALEILSTFYAFPIEEEAIRLGLSKTAWPGRFETVSTNPLIFLDGAHNEEGVKALVKTINETYPDKTVHLLFATLKDRNNESILQHLQTISEHITFTTFDFKRAEKAEELEKLGVEGKVRQDWRAALDELAGGLGAEELLLITGSLYFIAEVRRELKKYQKA
ncbi:bifunctional folylpolyglutamate synthase/dihydrofolate synthase [Pullulanibacillus sp. KACC 23026]|uniref:bifunctional folylpolyglutamate synthase/dihydrofolate synthase n=1 Tax=Pullulanibacillus sp. KACC 23026 TaxID=3028315 RepID=UPI0023AF3442|nr:folylpolyglutamate synthase/dihydrofolate synthase family protein [Pullulanibacillus sp. KACC 23026]WEG14046.1 bifunctional folylpolyglutamate synthase/dihydrofolate synthase [Pullulanibacillus sp. KACC 23026]